MVYASSLTTCLLKVIPDAQTEKLPVFWICSRLIMNLTRVSVIFRQPACSMRHFLPFCTLDLHVVCIYYKLLSQLILSLLIIESWQAFTTCPCFGHKLYVQFRNYHFSLVMVHIQDVNVIKDIGLFFYCFCCSCLKESYIILMAWWFT